MSQQLAGDIGGTKTILRWVESQLADTVTGVEITTLHTAQYVSREFTDLVPMVAQFLATATEAVGRTPALDAACFAIAGPVVNNTSNLTNLSWYLDSDRLAQALNIPQVDLINDFAAIGYGVLGLGDDDLHTLQAAHSQADAPLAIIGAGTGLGQGFVLRQGSHYHVFPSEGGHADFAPRSEIEFQLLSYLLDKHSITRVSAERVVSGQGIVSVYEFLRDRQKMAESPEIAQIVTTWEREAGLKEKSVDPAAAISQAAIAHRDSLSVRTMELFISAYGAEAGNLALKLLPYGGLYIAGGIAAKNLDLMTSGTFLSAFIHKGRVSGLLEQVPIHIVLDPQVGLAGAAQYAAQLSQATS